MRRALHLALAALTLALAGAYHAAPARGPAAVAPAAAAARAARAAPACMGRKGRPQMPQGMAMANNMQARQPDVPSDGTPIFYLYCRTGIGKPWYPVSAMKGDGQSKGLVNAWLNSPFGKGIFKDRLDEGMARSIFDSERRLAKMAVEQYKQLKENQARLQWGFKPISSEILAKEASGELDKVKIVPVNKGMIKEGLFQQAQAAAGSLIGGGEGGADAKKDGKKDEGPDLIQQGIAAAQKMIGGEK